MGGVTGNGRRAGGLKRRKGQAGARADSIWTRNFALLCLASLSLLVCAQVLLPTLPLYVLTIGGTQRDVGFVMGAYTICATIMRTVAARLSDLIGRKRVVISSLALMTLATMAYRAAGNVPFVGTIRCLHGLFYGLAGTSMGAIVADSLPAARMAEGLGYFGLMATLSMGLAPMIGIWLVNRFSYSVLFDAVTSMAVVTLLAALPVRSRKAGAPAFDRPTAGTLSNLLEKKALFPSAVMFLLSLVNGSMVYYIALYAVDLHIGNIGPFFAVSALFTIISRPVSRRMADRGHAVAVILIGFLALSVGMIAVGLSRTMARFLPASALVGLGFGFSMPTLQALAVRHVPAGRRGAATGTYYASFDMGIGAGAIVWGFVALAWGYRIMYLSTLIPLALAFAIYSTFKTKMGAPD